MTWQRVRCGHCRVEEPWRGLDIKAMKPPEGMTFYPVEPSGMVVLLHKTCVPEADKIMFYGPMVEWEVGRCEPES